MADPQKIDFARTFPNLFRTRWSKSNLSADAAGLNLDDLFDEYVKLRAIAPRRPEAGKTFFVGHTGIPSTRGRSNRDEEHLAIALCNFNRRWPRPGGGWFTWLDYQVPLKAAQSDARIGKIDLLGVSGQGRLIVTELKVHRKRGSENDNPFSALMEGLRYAAIIEANQAAVADEAYTRFGQEIVNEPPIVQLAAPENWWHHWLAKLAEGNWGRTFTHLKGVTETQTGVSIECIMLEELELGHGMNARAPRLAHVPAIYPVRPGQAQPIGAKLVSTSVHPQAASGYLSTLNDKWWAWAERNHSDKLKAPRSSPADLPVFKPEFAELNVVVPGDPSRAQKILATIHPNLRHQHFASLRSSQALTQCVVGAVKAFERLDLLASVTAECGRAAFLGTDRPTKLICEYELSSLQEPRPTSVDILLQGQNNRVAIECKFTETDFGTCSRPRLTQHDPSYAAQCCDGTYRAQAGRSERCALTSIGIRYWELLPELFDWTADVDQMPCPFRSTYQLARNALAATLSAEGQLDPASGHVLVIYDARNPSFQFGGDADRQWEAALAACLVPELFRRITWQRLLGFLATAPELKWLIGGLDERHGLAPDYGVTVIPR